MLNKIRLQKKLQTLGLDRDSANELVRVTFKKLSGENLKHSELTLLEVALELFECLGEQQLLASLVV